MRKVSVWEPFEDLLYDSTSSYFLGVEHGWVNEASVIVAKYEALSLIVWSVVRDVKRLCEAV